MVFASGFSDAPLRQQTDLPAGKSLLWGGSPSGDLERTSHF